ncbi:MAG TPA: type II secretion system protein [Candidatus Saccharimonadales bacterium]|nr:type II secretion system protein [Candidatus Saccharimonadales bacterium]
MRRAKQAGFTLPELLATVAIVVVLGVIAIFLLRETPQTADRYDSQRQTDTALLVQAVTNYRAKTGTLPDGITTTYKTIGSQDGELNLCKILVPNYLTDIPYDPTAGQAASPDDRCDAKDQEYTTGYQIKKDDAGTQITVQAPYAQGDKMVSITKKL